MPEMHLRQPGFTYSACRPFTKSKERIQKLKKNPGDSRYIYQNELDKACFKTIWLMETLKIYLEEQLLIRYYMIKYLILLNIQNMMDIREA